MASNLPVHNNGIYAMNNVHQYPYSHQNTGIIQPMVPEAPSYYHKPCIPEQAQTVPSPNEEIVYAQDMPSLYSFASSASNPSNHSNNSNSTVVYAQDAIYAQDYQFSQPQQKRQKTQVAKAQVNNNQYQTQHVPEQPVAIPMNTYNHVPVQPQQYNHHATVTQSIPYQEMSQMPMEQSSSPAHPGTHHQQTLASMQQSSSVHIDTNQQEPASEYASTPTSQHIPRKPVNLEITDVIQQEIEPVEDIEFAEDIDFYCIQQSLLWDDLYKQYESNLSLYKKVKLLATGHCDGDISEDMVERIKLEQMLNKERWQEIMEQSYTKFIAEQMNFIGNGDFKNKQIDALSKRVEKIVALKRILHTLIEGIDEMIRKIVNIRITNENDDIIEYALKHTLIRK